LPEGYDSHFDNLLLFWHQHSNSLELRAGAVLCTAAWQSGIFNTFCWHYLRYCCCNKSIFGMGATAVKFLFLVAAPPGK